MHSFLYTKMAAAAIMMKKKHAS